MASAIRCSIVINTYSRAPYLEKLLSAFQHLTCDDFEVIVVNGPSTDWTEELLERYGGRIKVVDCPETNLSLSRNLGIAAAAGDFVVFIDDDALPGDPAWLDNLRKAFENDPEGKIGAAGGGVLIGETQSYQFKGGATSDYSLQIFQDEEIKGRVLDGKRWVQGTAGGNCAFRRSALAEIGGFDEHFTYYLDETDVCLRLARRGYQIKYLQDCPIRHYPAPASDGSIMLRDRRVVTRSDTYYCLKNGGDGVLRRLLKTVRLAPQKHFVREVPKLWRNGQISTGDVMKFGWNWLRGFLEGAAIGLFARRRNRLSSLEPPNFVPFRKNVPQKKLRICLMSQLLPPNPNIGGIARYTWDLARGLHELGHEVHLIYKSEEPIRRESLGFTLHGISANEYLEKSIFPNSPVLNKNVSYSIAVFQKMIDLARQKVIFDVVHASNWDLEGLALPLAHIYPFLLVLVSPLAEIVKTEGWKYTDDLHACVALDRWQIEHADSICCPSWGVLEIYRKKMGMTFEKLLSVQRVKLGIVPSWMKRKDTSFSGLKRLLFVGRIEYRKGAHVLLEVLPELLATYTDWFCDLVGANQVLPACGSTLKEEFLRKHAGSPWLKRVHFHGVVSDVKLHELYSHCELFVAPSLFESFGLIYLEAMQYGKAVVGSRTGGVPEIVEDGVEGILVDPGDASGLREALARLMNNAHLREKLGTAGARKVREELNHLAMAKRFLACYYDVIDRKRIDCQRNLKQYQSFDGALFELGKVMREGEWQEKEGVPGKIYLFSDQSGANLRFQAQGGSLLVLTTLRHNYSGVLTVSTDRTTFMHLDLFSRQLLLGHVFRLKVPGNPNNVIAIDLTVHAERNPESRGNEVWLQGLLIIDSRDVNN